MSVEVLTRVGITFETADGGRTHAPLIAARLGDVSTLLILDTGSEVQLLNKELVDRLGLAIENGEEGTDHSGATMASWSVEDVGLELGEIEVTLRDVVAIPAPPPFPPRGIGGILSPQHLHPTATAVVDLAANELLLVEADDDELQEWLEGRSPDLTTLVLERDESFTTLVVAAAIRPHDEIPTMLNTGGKGTEFGSASVPSLAATAFERIGGGVSGADVLGANVGAATLVVAGREFPVADLAVRDKMHDPQGLVGMDVLRGTVIAAGADVGRPLVWQV